MSFITRNYLGELTEGQFQNLLATTSRLGTHPETGDCFLIPSKDRVACTHILGLPGAGKSGLLENLAMQDILNGQSVIFIDPHGDSVDHILTQLPYELMMDKVSHIHLLDMENEQYHFSLNPLASRNRMTVDRVMHIFEVQWPEITTQSYLRLYLRMAILALMDRPDSTLVDMYTFVEDGNYRWECLKYCKDPSVSQFWQAYESLQKAEREQQIMPLKTRLAVMFAGRPVVRKIIGQKANSINFREAIENKEIHLIKLPLKTLPQDARLIGAILTAQIHEAVFSFSDRPEKDRPGLSLYVDEWQNFASTDFAEMFTEGRKFRVRVTVANQFMSQLPSFLQDAVKTAYTKVCFRLTQEDAKERAPYFLSGETTIRPEHIDADPVSYLLKYGSDNPEVQTFVHHYLLELQSQKHSGQVEIEKPGIRWEHAGFLVTLTEPPKDKPKEADPTPYLNRLLYEVMKSGDQTYHIPMQIVLGFSNCGRGFYARFKYDLKSRYLTAAVRYPSSLVVEHNGKRVWIRRPENEKEQLYHFIYHLRATMEYLAANPIGKKTAVAATEVSQMLLELPRRAAFVRSGDDIGVIYTDDTLPPCDEEFVEARTTQIKVQTIQKYCHEVADVQPQNVADQDTQPLPAVKPQFKRYKEI